MLFRRKPADNRPSGPQPRRSLSRQDAGRVPSDMQARRSRQQSIPSAQNTAFSYYASRSQSEINLGREANQKKAPIRRLPTKLQRLRSHAGWLAAGVLVFGLIVYQMQLSTVPRIVTLSASSETPFLQDMSVYEKAAHELFDTSAVNRNKLTVDSAAIAKKLEAKFPELQEVSVSMPLIGNKPIVYIKPAEPALVLSANNGSFIVDENGRALAAVNANTDTSHLKIPSITDQGPLGVKLGDQVLPSTVTAFIYQVNEQYKAKQVGIESMVLPAAAGELDVYIAGQPYFVKFNIQDLGQGGGMQQIGTSLAVMNKLKGSGDKPSQYIDVRLEGRAYYQ